MDNFFKSQREQLGLSQRRLATLLGVSNQAVSGWESADSYPAYTPINRLAQIYQVSEDRMAKEVIALRRAIEERDAASATTK